jgi:hypothetical protein
LKYKRLICAKTLLLYIYIDYMLVQEPAPRNYQVSMDWVVSSLILPGGATSTKEKQRSCQLLLMRIIFRLGKCGRKPASKERRCESTEKRFFYGKEMK